jgi:hypothetical protein
MSDIAIPRLVGELYMVGVGVGVGVGVERGGEMVRMRVIATEGEEERRIER